MERVAIDVPGRPAPRLLGAPLHKPSGNGHFPPVLGRRVAAVAAPAVASGRALAPTACASKDCAVNERPPRLFAGWDLALMLFADTESTRHVSPTKTLQCVAGENPVDRVDALLMQALVVLRPAGVCRHRWPTRRDNETLLRDTACLPVQLPLPAAPGRLSPRELAEFERVVGAQRLPAGWVVAIVDERQRVVARHPGRAVWGGAAGHRRVASEPGRRGRGWARLRRRLARRGAGDRLLQRVGARSGVGRSDAELALRRLPGVCAAAAGVDATLLLSLALVGTARVARGNVGGITRLRRASPLPSNAPAGPSSRPRRAGVSMRWAG